MSIFDSPFYRLGASPRDNRQKLNSLAEDKEFFMDSETVSADLAVLTNLQRRLEAEICWFPATEQDVVDKIISCCEKLRDGAEPMMGSFSCTGLAELNTYVYRAELGKPSKQILLIQISEIAKVFEKLNFQNELNRVNADRKAAKFSEITDQNGFEQAIYAYRQSVAATLAKRIASLGKGEYTDLVIRISDSFLNDSVLKGNPIYESLLSDYELRSRADIEECIGQIHSQIQRIDSLAANKSSIADNVNFICNYLDCLKTLAMPICKLYAYTGREYSLFVNTGYEVRNLAVHLNNDYNLVDESLKIIEKLTGCYNESKALHQNLVQNLSIIRKNKEAKDQMIRAQQEQERIKAEEAAKNKKKTRTGCLTIIVLILAFCVFSVISSSNVGKKRSSSSDIWGDNEYLRKYAQQYLNSPSPKKSTPIPVKATPTPAKATKPPEYQYSDGLSVGMYTLVELKSVNPVIGLGKDQDINTDLICECETMSGEKVWLYISVEEYCAFIDSKANLKNSSSASFNALTYPMGLRVHGRIVSAEDVCLGLSKDISDAKLVSFLSIEELSATAIPATGKETASSETQTENPEAISPAGYAVVKSTVNVRSGPSSKSQWIGRAKANSVYAVLDTSNSSWCKIVYDGAEAYVSTSYIKITDLIPSGKNYNLDTICTLTPDKSGSKTTAVPAPTLMGKIIPTPTPTPTPVPTPTPRRPVSVSNGKILVECDYEGVCPLTIEADNDTDYYVYLEYLRAPSYSQENRKQKKGNKKNPESDLAFYVTSGSKAKVEVPIGVYKMYYATGKGDFYGTTDLWDETRYYTADDEFVFNASNGYYNGHTITLYKVVDGNLETDPIPEQAFPKK